MSRFNPLLPQPAGHFREAVKALSPPWLQNWNGYRFTYSLAIQLDAIAEYARIGALQRFPDHCEEEALGHIGQDRQITRGPTEPASSYRARLRSAFPTWRRAGHPKAVLGQLAGYFSPSPPVMRYVTNGYDEAGNTVSDWWTLSGGVYTYHRATPANWNWDNRFGIFRFWIILYVPLLDPWLWDEAGRYFDEPGLLWGYRGGAFVADVLAIVDKWKAAGSHMENLILASDTTQVFNLWGQAGLAWGGGSTWGQNVPGGPMFAPNATPGYPMPNGDWNDDSNRDPNAQYLQGV